MVSSKFSVPSVASTEFSQEIAGPLLRLVRELAQESNPRLKLGPVSLGSALDRDLGIDSFTRAELLVRLELAAALQCN